MYEYSVSEIDVTTLTVANITPKNIIYFIHMLNSKQYECSIRVNLLIT